MVQIKEYRGGMLDSTTYLVYDSGEAMIIDCGKNVQDIADFVNKNELSVNYIVLTHGHCDHCAMLEDYTREFPSAKIICHTKEVEVLANPDYNLSGYIFGSPCAFNYDFIPVDEGESIYVGTKEFKILHTPGHTPGCICLACEEENILFTGDLLFANGYGRTDFPLGSYGELVKSLKRVMTSYPNANVFPGHGFSVKMKNIGF